MLLQEFSAYSEHLRKMDERALRAQTISTYLGQAFGLIIGLTAIGAGSYTAIHASPLAGGFIGGGGVIGLVSVFVIGRRKSE